MSEGGKDLKIRVLNQRSLQSKPDLGIRVVSQKSLDRAQLAEVSTSSDFRQFLDSLAGYFRNLFVGQEPDLDIRVIRTLPSVPPETLDVDAELVRDNRIKISVLRTYLTTKRSLTEDAWGTVNSEAKRSAFARPHDSAFDLPIRVLRSFSISTATQGAPSESGIRVRSQNEISETDSPPIVIYDQEWIRRQAQQMISTFGQERVDTPIHLNNHHLQEYRFGGPLYNGRSVSSCLAASVYNALEALELRHGVSEDDLIRNGIFLDNGSMDALSAISMLSQRNIPSYPTDSLIEITRILEQHGVVILMSNWHAKLVSGLESNGSGNIRFRVNDPLNRSLLYWTPSELAQHIASGINETRQRNDLVSPFDYSCIAIQPNLNIHVIPRQQV